MLGLKRANICTLAIIESGKSERMQKIPAVLASFFYELQPLNWESSRRNDMLVRVANAYINRTVH